MKKNLSTWQHSKRSDPCVKT